MNIGDDFAFARNGIGKITVFEDFRTAVFIEVDCFHPGACPVSDLI